MAIARLAGKAAMVGGLAAADVAGALPLLAAAGLIGAGMAKGWGGKSDKDKEDKSDTIAKTSIAGASATEAARDVLEKILVEVEGIHQTLKDRVVPESLKKELALDARTRHRELVASIKGMVGTTGDTPKEKKETWWDKLKKFMSWILNPKTWAKALLVTGGIVTALLWFVRGVGAFFLSPVGLALLAVIVVAINWRKIKATIRGAIKSIKQWGKSILNTLLIPLGWLVDTSVDFLADEDDPTPDMGMDDTIGEEDVGRATSNYGILRMLDQPFDEPVVPMEMDDPVGDAEFEVPPQREGIEGEDWWIDENGKLHIIISGVDEEPAVSDPRKGPGTAEEIAAYRAEHNQGLLDEFNAMKNDFIVAQTNKHAEEVERQNATIRHLNSMLDTTMMGGIPLVGAPTKKLSEEEQFIEDLRARGASEEAIALSVRMKFRSQWEQSLTSDEERNIAEMEEGGSSQKAIKHRIQMDRNAREKGFKNQAEYLASIPEKGETKQSSMWVLPKDTQKKTYKEGWQVKRGFGDWEDVADQDVPTTSGYKGVTTASHTRYKQKAGSPSVSSSSQASTPSTGSQAGASLKLPTGSSPLSNVMSSFSNLLPKATASVQTGGNQVQLGMTITGAGRIGTQTITVTTNTDTSSTWSSTTGSTQTAQRGFPVNNNHTQPPYTGRDA